MTGKLFFIICIQTLLCVQQAYATTYYVSPMGIDSNDGTSLSTPVKTIKKGLSNATLNGDIVYVMTGTYVETVYIGQSHITLSAYLNNKPIIDGETTLPDTNWGSLIYVAGNNNTISGFEVKNSNIEGIHLGGYGIEVEGHHNTISNMNVHHIWETGIQVTGDYNIVEDSTIWQSSRAYINTPESSGWGSGLSAARNQSADALKSGVSSYAILRRNVVFNNYGEGVSCFEADYCTIEDNVVYDNWTFNVYLSDATNSVVQRNIIYISSTPAIPTRHNSHPAIMLADEVLEAPRSAYNKIINNLIYNGDFNAFAWSQVPNSGLNNVLIANNTIVDGRLLTGEGEAIINIDSQIRNNIILGEDSVIPSNQGILFSNNNWSVTPPLAKSDTDVTGDPKIARTGTTSAGTLTANYFKIVADSPLINTATSLPYVTGDFFKAVRDTKPDIGGYEFQASEQTNSDTCGQIIQKTVPNTSEHEF